MIYGKAKTPKYEWPHHYNHPKDGEIIVREMCNRLDLPNIFKYSGMVAAKEHMRASLFNEMKITKKVDFLVANAKTKLGIEGLEVIVNSDKKREVEIKFAELGNQMIKEVNGKNITKDNFEEIKEEIRKNRINWLKEKINNKKENQNGL